MDANLPAEWVIMSFLWIVQSAAFANTKYVDKNRPSNVCSVNWLSKLEAELVDAFSDPSINLSADEHICFSSCGGTYRPELANAASLSSGVG